MTHTPPLRKEASSGSFARDPRTLAVQTLQLLGVRSSFVGTAATLTETKARAQAAAVTPTPAVTNTTLETTVSESAATATSESAPPTAVHVQQALDSVLGQRSPLPQKGQGALASGDLGLRAGSGLTSKTGFVPKTQGKKSKSHAFSRHDNALTTELVYGSLRRFHYIDTIVRAHLRAPDKLPLLVLQVLYIGCYGLLFLDRVPAHATVNWASGYVKSQYGVGLSRVVNGVLRTMTRIETSLRDGSWLADQIHDPMKRLSIHHSVPLWVLKLWTQAYGDDAARAYAAASDTTPWVCVRMNVQHPEWQQHKDFLLAQGGEAFGVSGIRFAPGRSPNLLPLEREGILSRQGSGAQDALTALDAQLWEGPIWDACAGRGGKSFFLLELGKELSLASDPHAGRLRGFHEDAHRLGLKQPQLICAAAQQVCAARQQVCAPAQLVCEPAQQEDTTCPLICASSPQECVSGQYSAQQVCAARQQVCTDKLHTVPDGMPLFRTILLDLPCSGLGTLARRPDISLHRTPAQLEGLVNTQRVILQAVWPQLEAGGRLIYLTCTLNPAENEEQVAWMLHIFADACLIRQWQSVPGPYGADMMFAAEIKKTRPSTC